MTFAGRFQGNPATCKIERWGRYAIIQSGLGCRSKESHGFPVTAATCCRRKRRNEWENIPYVQHSQLPGQDGYRIAGSVAISLSDHRCQAFLGRWAASAPALFGTRTPPRGPQEYSGARISECAYRI